jgi:hypothetical protein
MALQLHHLPVGEVMRQVLQATLRFQAVQEVMVLDRPHHFPEVEVAEERPVRAEMVAQAPDRGALPFPIAVQEEELLTGELRAIVISMLLLLLPFVAAVRVANKGTVVRTPEHQVPALLLPARGSNLMD